MIALHPTPLKICSAKPKYKFSAMKREDVKNKIPSITDIAQAPEEARLGKPARKQKEKASHLTM